MGTYTKRFHDKDFQTVNLELQNMKVLLIFICIIQNIANVKGKSLSEALLFAEHGEKMLCTKTVLNVRTNFCTHHVLPKFELGIFMY